MLGAVVARSLVRPFYLGTFHWVICQLGTYRKYSFVRFRVRDRK